MSLIKAWFHKSQSLQLDRQKIVYLLGEVEKKVTSVYCSKVVKSHNSDQIVSLKLLSLLKTISEKAIRIFNQISIFNLSSLKTSIQIKVSKKGHINSLNSKWSRNLQHWKSKRFQQEILWLLMEEKATHLWCTNQAIMLCLDFLMLACKSLRIH